MMDEKTLALLLKKVKEGSVSITEALEAIKRLPFEEMDGILFDHHRLARKGLPEVVYGPGKSAEQLINMARKFVSRQRPLLATRVGEEKAANVLSKVNNLEYDRLSRCLSFCPVPIRHKVLDHGVLIITAGTSDMPVALEAAQGLRVIGFYSEIIQDVGVAGIHRLLDHLDKLFDARVIIVVAGMEGALPSVIAGIAKAPVIAVPTSVGYGSNFNGLVPLLAMLNSCAPGIGVVNIDNGIGAAFLAASILNASAKAD